MKWKKRNVWTVMDDNSQRCIPLNGFLRRRMMEDLYNEKEFLKRNEAEFAKPKRKIKKKKASLAYLKNIAWDPNDKSLTAHFKEFRADAPPPVEEE